MAAFDPNLQNVEQLSESDPSKVLVCRGATPSDLHRELKNIFFDRARRQGIINTLNSSATTLYDDRMQQVDNPSMVVDLDTINTRFVTFQVVFDGVNPVPQIYLVQTAAVPGFHCVQLDAENPIGTLISDRNSVLHPLIKKIMHDAVLHKYNERGPISYYASLDIYYNRPRSAAGRFHRDSFIGRGNNTDQVSLHFFMDPGDLALGPEVVKGIDATGRVIDPSEIQDMLDKTDLIPTRLLVGDGTNIGFSDTAQIHATPGLHGNLSPNLTNRLDRIEGRTMARDSGLNVPNPNTMSKNEILLAGDIYELENDIALARTLGGKIPVELEQRIAYKQQIVDLRREIIATNPKPRPLQFESDQEHYEWVNYGLHHRLQIPPFLFVL